MQTKKNVDAEETKTHIHVHDTTPIYKHKKREKT